MKKFIVSIDQGTTSSKVVLYNKNFHVIDILQKEFRQFFPKNGWVEHDPIEIFKDIKFLIKKLIKKNDIKCSEIISIGIANQRETTVLWDKLSGKPVYKAIVWQDRRTIPMCKKLINKKLASKIQKITGLVIDPYFSATKIKWLLNNVRKTKKLLKENRLLFGTIDTWLLWNLTEKNLILLILQTRLERCFMTQKKKNGLNQYLNFFKYPIKFYLKLNQMCMILVIQKFLDHR